MGVHDLLGSKAVADKYGIDKIPAIAVLGEGDRDHGIRLFGMPAGYEFSSLLEAVKMASSGASGLSPEAREALKGLKKSIHIQVFNLPLLSHGGANGHRLAVESDLIKADMIDLRTAFQELNGRISTSLHEKEEEERQKRREERCPFRHVLSRSMG